MPIREPDPAVMRRRLRRELRVLREAAGFTQRGVADEMEWSLSKVIRMESGTVGVSITDLRALLAYYGVSDQGEVDRLVTMARAAKAPPWWAAYRALGDKAFQDSLGYEGAASLIRTFEPVLVPGLLQTEEYALAVLELTSSEQAERMAQLRLERQERLLGPDGPQLHFILDENVVTRVVGSRAVMRRQLRQLQELAEHPQITLRIVPFDAGLYPYFRTPYVLYEFNPDDDVVLYIERQDQEHIVHESSSGDDVPARYLEAFFSIEPLAPGNQARPLLESALERLTGDRSSEGDDER